MKSSSKKIKVGIIGVSAERGWASMAHIPAIKSLPEYELTAISNWNKDAVELAGKKWNVPFLFTSAQQLVESPEVDLVVITVKVRYHLELVLAALNSGKNVYCEWPLGLNAEQAETMSALAKERGLHGTVGLQSRAVPSINYIKDLLKDGYIGDVLSTSMIGSGILQGESIEQVYAYTADAQNSASMLYTTFGNTIDALCYCLGEFASLNTTAATRRRKITVKETGELINMTAYDQVALTGVLQSGAVASVHYRGGMSKGTNFHWEINGTKGDLIITADGGHTAVFELKIKGADAGNESLEALPVPDWYFSQTSALSGGPAFNLSQQYLRLAKDLSQGTHLSPTFSDALIRHQMLEAIERSAITGERESYLDDQV